MDKLTNTALEYIRGVEAYIEAQVAKSGSVDALAAELNSVKTELAADRARFDDLELALRSAIARIPA